jgi:hypothetical protein
VLAGKLAIPFSSLPRQLPTYHTFLLCTASVQYVFTEIYHYKNSNCDVPENGSNLQFFLCVCVCLAQVLTKFHSPSTNTFCLASFYSSAVFFNDAYCKKNSQQN